MTNKCLSGHHPLIKIYSDDIDCFVTKIIRWCPKCGSIVMDREVDGRLNPGYYMGMKEPELYKKYKEVINKDGEM